MTTTETAELIDIIEGLAHEYGERGIRSLRRDYSGRGMFGAKCFGIETSHPLELIVAAVVAGLRGSKRDSMGTGTIVYWENITQ